MGAWPVETWLRLAARYGAREVGQDFKAIDGARGWLEYLSKHSSRTATHYQRRGKPEGWESTGRVWRYGGEWPRGERLRVHLDEGSKIFHRFRRLVRSMVVADARADVLAAIPGTKKHRDAVKRLRWARRMLRCAEPGRSAARGVGEWMPSQEMTLALALCAGWSGELVEGVAAA